MVLTTGKIREAFPPQDRHPKVWPRHVIAGTSVRKKRDMIIPVPSFPQVDILKTGNSYGG